MENLKNFTLWKNRDKAEGDKKPDYTISAKIGDKYITIGGAWLKDLDTKSVTPEGKPIMRKYISCALSKPYKEQKGYKIIEE